MISQRSEYLFVTIPSSIRVDSDVMPKRYHNEAKRKVLRGLDAAMMLECLGERKNVTLGYDAKTALGRELSGTPFRDAALWCRGNCGSPSRWRQQVEESTGFWNVGNVGLMSVYGRTIALLSLECDPDDFLSGKPLVADKLMKLYRDMNEFRRFIAPISSETRSSSNYDISHAQAGSSDGHGCDAEIAQASARYSSGGTSMGGNEVYYHVAFDWRTTVFESKGRYQFTANLASGTYRAMVPANAKLDLYGEAQAYALIHTVCTRPSGEWWDWIRVPSEKHTSFHGYGISAPVIAAAAALARSYGERVPVLGMDSVGAGNGQTINQYVDAFALVVDLTDHTDFSEWLGGDG